MYKPKEYSVNANQKNTFDPNTETLHFNGYVSVRTTLDLKSLVENRSIRLKKVWEPLYKGKDVQDINGINVRVIGLAMLFGGFNKCSFNPLHTKVRPLQVGCGNSLVCENCPRSLALIMEPMTKYLTDDDIISEEPAGYGHFAKTMSSQALTSLLDLMRGHESYQIIKKTFLPIDEFSLEEGKIIRKPPVIETIMGYENTLIAFLFFLSKYITGVISQSTTKEGVQYIDWSPHRVIWDEPPQMEGTSIEVMRYKRDWIKGKIEEFRVLMQTPGTIVLSDYQPAPPQP